MSNSRSLRTSAAATALVAGLLACATTSAASATGDLAPTSTWTAVSGAGAVLPALAPRPADSLNDAFGVNTHLGAPGIYDNAAAVKSALTGLGVRHIRNALYAGDVAQWNALKSMYAAGIRSNLIMGNPEARARPADLMGIVRSQLPVGLVESFEGVNEWNLSGHADWVAETKAHQIELWNAAKASPLTRDLPILAPSLGMRSGFEELGDLSAHSDAANLHLYPGGQQPSVLINDNIRNGQVVAPGKPVIFTEAGYHNAMNTPSGHVPTPEDVAGVYAPRLLLEHYTRGVQRMYNYQLLDEDPDPTDVEKEHQFGLLEYDFTPKPAYTALKNLLQLTSDPGPAFATAALDYQVSGATPDVRQVLLQKRDGSYALVLWRDVSVYDRLKRVRTEVPDLPVQVELAGQAAVQVFQPSESAAALTTATGVSEVDVPLDGDVTIVKITPSVAAATAAPAAAPQVTATARNAGTDVTWAAPVGGGQVSGYRVSAVPVGGAGLPVVVQAPVLARSAALSGLTNGVSYTVTVTPTGPAGSGPATASAPFTPYAPAGIVLGVTAAPRDGAALVSWTKPLGGPVTSYTVRDRRDGDTVTVTGTSVLFPGLTNGAYYSFSVTADGPGGEGLPSLASNVVRPGPVPGAVPTITGKPAYRGVSVTWTKPTTGGAVTKYELETTPATTTKVLGATATTALMNGLTPGVRYTVTITPVNASGEGRSTTAAAVLPNP